MRKTLNRLVAATTSLADAVAATTTSNPAVIHKELTLLHSKNIVNLACWKGLSDASKNALKISAELAGILDKAAANAGNLSSAKRIAILYGSQTGTAETYAKMLGTYAASHGLTPVVSSMNDGVQLLASNPPDLTVFLCSTCGVGEIPSNAKGFFKAINKGNLNVEGLKYCIFGMGNSHNENFNAAAKLLSEKLQTAKATSLMRMQLSCELKEGGHEAAFRTWKKNLWSAIGTTTEGRKFQATYRCTPVFAAKPERHIVRPDFFPTVVHQNTLVSAYNYEPRHRLLGFEIDALTQQQVFGREVEITDHVEVLPVNETALVNRALQRLNIDADSIVEVTPLAGAPKSFFAYHKLTHRTILSEIVDLSAIPSRSTLEGLSLLAKDETEAKALEDLANNLQAGSAYEKLTSGIFTLVDALEQFRSVEISLGELMTIAPIIAPRQYSIASDHSKGKHARFDLLVSVPTRTEGDKKHTGLCSGMLDRVQPGDKINIRFVESAVTLARDSSNVLYIALGTGIGSVHAALQHRVYSKAAGKKVGKAHLFYGFRHADKDCLFQDDFQEMKRTGLLTVTNVASHDGPKFVSPLDKIDASVTDFIGQDGEVVYCGLGGSIPGAVEAALKRAGVDVATLRATGRYHEEFFTADVDTENLLKGDVVATENSATLASRMGKCDMFCFQCEQTLKGRGCHKIGVCGKTPRVANLQDLTVHAVKVLGFYAHELRQLGVVDSEANHLTLFGLFSTLTNVNFDEQRFVAIIHDIKRVTDKLAARYAAECLKVNTTPKVPQCLVLPVSLPHADGLVELGRLVGVLTRFTDPATQNAAGVSEMLMYGLKGIAAYTDHSLQNKKEDETIYAFLHKALAFLTTPDQFDLGKGLALCLEAGNVNVAAMGLLYTSHKTLGVPTPTQAVLKPVPGKCILVSGHDLIILKRLLEATEPLGINVYTHGEMLPAHSYPELKKHKNLVGHFGGAWMRQAIEFPHFPGPVLMTTNCITEPHESYAARIFTAGAVGWTGVQHVGNTPDDIKFDAVIASAKEMSGFAGGDTTFAYPDPVGTVRPAAYTVGFGHETILSVAPTIIEEIKKGNITRFFLVGGCDGFEGDRSYYTELVSNLPKTAVVLTVGCGKFRINHLNLGTIGDTGIPRILDMGQCNDSFSAVQVALALADVLKCKVSDLPLSIVLSWFEQKAVAVLLSCISLGLKPIHIGPALPAFATPDVLNVLVKDFGLVPLGNVHEDIKTMCAATGAS